MPRNGAGIYSKPANTTAVPNATIESVKYNSTIDDLVTDANTARPIVAGGTGATTVAGAQTALLLDGKVVYTAKSANYTAVAADNNATLRFTAAATLSLTAAATLAANWHLTVIADGGDVTIDPNASETINGATTLRVPDGSYAVIICTGTAFYASVMSSTIYGSCRLTLSGGNLLLSRFNGRRLTINGVGEVIPSAGATLAPTGLTPATLYYIYAYMNSGTMTLESSTTASAVDSTTGIRIKNGDATRTLVGMVRPVTGPVFSDTMAQRFVRSWYNEHTIDLFNLFTANRTTTSPSYAELNPEIRCEFLVWSSETVSVTSTGSWINGAANGASRTSLGFDGTTSEVGGAQQTFPTSDTSAFAVQSKKTGLSEGYHYVTLLGLVASGTGTWISDVDGRRTTIMGNTSR